MSNSGGSYWWEGSRSSQWGLPCRKWNYDLYIVGWDCLEWLAAGKPPFSSWVERTIFLYSLTQGISSGVRRPELNLSLLTPGLEINFVDQALERLSAVGWYLDNDPITLSARFKEEPSINKIIAEKKDQVGVSEAKDDLRSRRDTIFANKLFTLVAAPEGTYIDAEDVRQVNRTLKKYRSQGKERISNLSEYLQRFSDAVDYDYFHAIGLPIGSGEVESAHRYIPQKRLKIPPFDLAPRYY